jgi:exosome complex RNA-binding protein Rrp4
MLVYQQFFIDFKFVSPIQSVTCGCKSTGISKLKPGAFLKIMGRKLKKAMAPQGAFFH